METYIALLRGINVGGKNILPMKELSRILEGLGCSSVQTYIQSGNVVFMSAEDAPTLGTRIRTTLAEQAGVDAEVLLLTRTQLEHAASQNPFPADEGKALHYFFMSEPASRPDLARIQQLQSTTEQHQLQDQVFYLYAPEGIGRSKLAAQVEKCLGVAVTARNGNTVNKLLQMLEAID